MKKVIKQRTEESFLCADGSWNILEEAIVFESIEDAMMAARQLRGVDLIYLFEGKQRGPLDIVLRLRD